MTTQEHILGLLMCVAAISVGTAEGDDFSRGFGTEIQWRESLSKGLEEARETNKLLLLVIHKPWCGACKAFKPKFAGSNEIKELSKNFVMVNSEEDEEIHHEQYSPDGSYFPRIVFMDPSGGVLNNIYNEDGNDKYKYYYSSPEQVINSMNRVLQYLNDFGTTKKEL